MRPPAREVARLLPDGDAVTAVEPLHGDGSARRFFRVRTPRATYVLLEGPDRAENGAYARLSRHLAARGVRVPRVYGTDDGRGWLLVEDLGDRSLFRAVREAPPGAAAALYTPVLGLLARFQVHGARGYRPELGFVREPYGPRLMVEEEGLYFVREFAGGLLGLSAPAGLRAELEGLASRAATAPAGYLLHRDFQSRNVHLLPDGPAAIDFQGARAGPLAYDAAALILDPYAALPPGVRRELLTRYRAEASALGADLSGFDDHWFALGAFRLLQALGAFGKLGGRLGKPGFLEHAAAALDHLVHHLGERGAREFPVLSGFAGRARRAWAERTGADGRR